MILRRWIQIMVEFVEGSGFYPPTFNSFNANTGTSSQNIGNETVTFTILIDDRVELTSLSFFHSMTATGSIAGSYTVNVRIGRSLITNYTFSATSSGIGTYLDTLIQNTSIQLNKNDTITFEITGSGLSGGQGTHVVSVTVFGKYVL